MANKDTLIVFFFPSLLFCHSKELHTFFFRLFSSIFERCFIGMGEEYMYFRQFLQHSSD